jgi:Spy/CpxP family protein refolding chaperone
VQFVTRACRSLSWRKERGAALVYLPDWPMSQEQTREIKHMKKSILAVVAVAGLTAAIAVAAPNATNEGGHRGHGGKGGYERGAGRLAERLNLSEAQKLQWQALEQSFRDNNKALFEKSRQTMNDFRAAKKAGDTAKADSLKPTVDAQRAQMKQLRDAQEQKLVAILTPAQRTQFEALKAERGAHRGEHGRGRGGDRSQQ